MRISGRERRLLEACKALVEVHAMRVAGNAYGASVRLPQAVAAAQASFTEYGQGAAIIIAVKEAEQLANMVPAATPKHRKV